MVGVDQALGVGEDLVVVLDDGFQHLRLERDLDIVVIDAGDPWGGGHLPPLGRLREPIAALRSADAVLVTKVPDDWRPVVAEIESVVDRVSPALQVFVARLRPVRVRVTGEGWCDPSVLSGQRVFAFAGLGRPQGFAATLAEAGAELVDSRWFPDHHDYRDQDVREVVAAAQAANAVPVTTAKDAVKLPADAEVWVVEAEMEPIEGSWRGLWRLLPGVAS